MYYSNGSRCLSSKGLVNLAAFINLDTALDLKLLKIVPDQVLSYGAMQDAYTIGPIHIMRNWQDAVLYSCQSSAPGLWTDSYFKRGGDDIVSLMLHLKRCLLLKGTNPSNDRHLEFLKEVAVQFQPEATEQTIIEDLAKRLGIDVHQPIIRQPAKFRGWSQVAWVSQSSPQFGTHPEKDSVRRWPKYRPDCVPFIGQPTYAFEIRDASGFLQQVIGYWPTALGVPLLLSFTPWYKDLDPLHQRWKFGQSALRTCPYGLSTAFENKDATVVIDDDLLTVDRENPRLFKHHGAGIPIVFVAWPRGLHQATPAGTDWSCLRGRKVIVAVSNDRESFSHAFELSEELRNVGVESVEFVLPKNLMDENDKITVDYKGGELRGSRKDASELAEIAKQKFGISAKIMSKTALSSSWKIGDQIPALMIESMMPPWLYPATINLIYGKAGGGKSWFALKTIHSLATGTKFLGRLEPKERFRCLYLAGEMVSKICRRMDMIQASISNCKRIENIEIYPRPGNAVGKMNLELAETWEILREYTDNADIIVVDPLTKFTVGHNSAVSWSLVSTQLRKLTEKGKTIIILHHEGKDGKQRGTTELDDEIDTKIHLQSLPRIENGVLVTFEKHRDDETLGKALKPFELRWDKGPNGLLRWEAIDAEASETKTWVPLPEMSNDTIRSVNESFIQATFGGREADIIRCLTMAVLKGKPGLLRQEIDDQIGASGSTTRSVITDLVTKGSVVVEGKGKATRYALSDELKKSIIHE
ncbi:MAG: AAA family ATPase [Formivibrio sp.]|nr:AAA family ATPase [Formivibrio sp.]